jgi:Ni/Co efflux regulator RcnB
MKLFKNAMMTGLMLAIAAPMIIPAAAQAQSRELRRDRQDIREEQRDLRQARRNGTARDVREERRDVREARQEFREDRREYREDVREDRRDNREDAQENRREYREDLRDYRNHRASNRNAYRGSRFSANFRYQNFRPGARIGANYYAPRYVMSNYRNYRLPRPGARQAWVRHYNDVLLINVRTGRVLRAIPNFYY